MKRAAVPSILVVVVLLAVGVTAEAQQPVKVPRIGSYPRPDPALSHACRGISAGSARAWLRRRKEHRHRVPIRGGEASIGTPRSRPSWCVSRSISSWQQLPARRLFRGQNAEGGQACRPARWSNRRSLNWYLISRRPNKSAWQLRPRCWRGRLN